MTSKTDGNCCILNVEDLLAEGQVPIDAVIDAIFGERTYREVKLISKFDPIPLRLRLKKMGCRIIREDINEGWSFSISYDDDKAGNTAQVASSNKPTFSFDGEMLNLDVLNFEFPDNFLEVIRFIDRSPEEDRLRIKIAAFPQRLRFLLKERGWSGEVEEKQNDHVVLLLEKN